VPQHEVVITRGRVAIQRVVIPRGIGHHCAGREGGVDGRFGNTVDAIDQFRSVLDGQVVEVGDHLGTIVAAGCFVARIADGRPVVTASSGLVYGGDAEPHDEADAVRPLAFALADVAAERAFDPEATRVLRTGWVYGDGGVFAMLVLALAARRHRIVGPGDNLWSLVSAEDAANALVRLASLPAGVYHASESDERPPTQDDVVDALCKGGLRRPDRAPRWLATATIGGPMAEALGASLWLTAERLRAAGWVAASDWRAALANLARAPGGRPGRPGAGGGGRA